MRPYHRIYDAVTQAKYEHNAAAYRDWVVNAVATPQGLPMGNGAGDNCPICLENSTDPGFTGFVWALGRRAHWVYDTPTDNVRLCLACLKRRLATVTPPGFLGAQTVNRIVTNRTGQEVPNNSNGYPIALIMIGNEILSYATFLRRHMPFRIGCPVNNL